MARTFIPSVDSSARTVTVKSRLPVAEVWARAGGRAAGARAGTTLPRTRSADGRLPARWVNRPSSACRSPIATNLRVRCRERGSPCVGVPAPDAGDGGSRMRPVRFVALSEDGQALVLADE